MQRVVRRSITFRLWQKGCQFLGYPSVKQDFARLTEYPRRSSGGIQRGRASHGENGAITALKSPLVLYTAQHATDLHVEPVQCA